MAFPNLTPKADNRQGATSKVSDIVAEATGQPDNGVQTVGLPFVSQGIDPTIIDEEWLQIRCDALGPSVTGCTFVSLAADKLSMDLSFTQSGTDQATVKVTLIHSVIS